MSDKHTPGPWVLQDDGTIENQLGQQVCLPAWGEDFPCLDEEDTVTREIKTECEANAHLIVAAPELLAALLWAANMAEEAILVREEGGDPDDTPDIIAMHREKLTEARAAIAKATGTGP